MLAPAFCLRAITRQRIAQTTEESEKEKIFLYIFTKGRLISAGTAQPHNHPTQPHTLQR
jgi:hypothetical protein